MPKLRGDRSVMSFHQGEISQRMAGRADMARTTNACRILRNMTVGVYGSAKRRVGTKFIATVKGS